MPQQQKGESLSEAQFRYCSSINQQQIGFSVTRHELSLVLAKLQGASSSEEKEAFEVQLCCKLLLLFAQVVRLCQANLQLQGIISVGEVRTQQLALHPDNSSSHSPSAHLMAAVCGVVGRTPNASVGIVGSVRE